MQLLISKIERLHSYSLPFDQPRFNSAKRLGGPFSEVSKRPVQIGSFSLVSYLHQNVRRSQLEGSPDPRFESASEESAARPGVRGSNHVQAEELGEVPQQ